MHLPDEFRSWVLEFVSSDIFKQIVPLLVLFLFPALFLFVAKTAASAKNGYIYSLFASAIMGIENYLPWMWSSSSAASGSTGSTGKSGSREKKKDRKAIRTRAEQIQLNGNAKQHGSGKEEEDEGYYPGLVNVSGTYCFMNSTLQALASLSYLQPHIDAIHAKAEALDVPTPVIDALKELFQDLNTPKSAYRAIRPMDIINVLSQQTEGRTNSLFYSREHQDAQELFQVVSECIKNELAAVDKEGLRDRGFGSALDKPSETTKEIGKSVFDGLTANRRSCVVCGYTEAVMHFAFDNWQLSVPRMAGSCRLEDCLEDYTRLEILKDCICRKCSLVATHNRLKQELATLEEATKPGTNPSSSKKRRLKEVRKFEARVRAALAEGRIEDDLKDVRIEKVFSPASTKQAMIARPPPVLALHLNRSIHYGHYAGKNNCRVAFPEVLDLTPFTTSGSLSTIPTASISTPPPAVPRSTTPTPSTYSNQRTIYRLAAVVCHFGGHSFGHYICYRRKPRPTGLPKEKRFAPPVLVDPLRIPDGDVDDENQAQSQGPEYIFEDGETQPGKGWLRISDDSVRECGIESVLAEGAGVFMLYYERAVPPRPGIYPSQSGTRVSEETLRPEMKTVELNGSVGSLVSEVGVGVMASPRSTPASVASSPSSSWVKGKEREILGGRGSSIGLASSLSTSWVEPRVIRSVAAGRGRSTSTQPSSSVGSLPLSSSLPSESTLKSHPNGNATHSEESNEPATPSLIAPAAKIPKTPLDSKTNGTHLPDQTEEEKPAVAPSTPKKSKPGPKLHSPKPVHPPASAPVVDSLES